jgi:HSP20 family protein
MAIMRYEPFRELETLQRQMNHLFDDFWAPVPKPWTAAFATTPPAELEETADAILLKLELPGMNPSDLDVQVMEEAVAISGERKSENKTEEGGVTRSEFHYGSFQRLIPLPTRVQNTNVQAEYTDGILRLTLPKAEEEKRKAVKVNIG